MTKRDAYADPQLRSALQAYRLYPNSLKYIIHPDNEIWLCERLVSAEGDAFYTTTYSQPPNRVTFYPKVREKNPSFKVFEVPQVDIESVPDEIEAPRILESPFIWAGGDWIANNDGWTRKTSA